MSKSRTLGNIVSGSGSTLDGALVVKHMELVFKHHLIVQVNHTL